jgi:peptide/nickel transport system substrate-binding protein
MKSTDKKSSGSRVLTCVVLSILFLFMGLAEVQARDMDEVVIANGWGAFNCVGGDPATQTGAPPYASRLVFDSLINVTQDRQWVPAIAKSWKISAGWKYIDYFLRDDVKFSNGEPVTAEDIVYSFEQYMRKDLKYVFSPMWNRNVTKVEIIDPLHIRVHLANADWGLTGRLWWGGGIMPKAYREKVGDKGFADKPIGSGPFTWVDYKQDSWFRVKAVKKHFRRTPKIKGVKVVYVQEHSTRLAMLKTGEADIAFVFGAHIAEVETNPDLNIQWIREVQGANIYYADMVDPNLKSPFKDIRVRHAASLAIDRAAICKHVLFDSAEPWGDVLPSITLGHDKTLKPPEYDPKKARKLLAEAGYASGIDTEMHVLSSNTTAEAVAASLTAVGIRTQVKKYEPGAFYGGVFGKTFRGLLPYVGWYDPEIQAPAELSDFYSKGTPHAYYTTDELDALMRKGMFAENDEKMAEYGRKISKLIRDQELTTFLWATHQAWGVNKRITNWEPTLGGMPAIEFETLEIAR